MTTDSGIIDRQRMCHRSYDHSLTMQKVLNFPDEYWDWCLISRNPGIKVEDIINNPNKPWHWWSISRNPNLTMKFVLDNPDKPWHWWSISSNPGITMQDILNNPDKPWDWVMISANLWMEKMTGDSGNIDDSYWVWNWDYFSRNPHITLKEVFNNPSLPWVWGFISSNPGITMQNILDNLDKSWEWDILSENSSITISDIKSHPNLLWDWGRVSKNHNITMKFILDNPNLPWDWYSLTQNPGIGIQDILDNPNMNWDHQLIDESSTKLESHPILRGENNLSPGEYYSLLQNRYPYHIPGKPWKNTGIPCCILTRSIYNPYFMSIPYKKRLAKKVADLTRENSNYIAKVYNPNRMRSFTAIQDLEEMRLLYGWSTEEFNEYIK